LAATRALTWQARMTHDCKHNGIIAHPGDQMEWEKFGYYEILRNQFSTEECAEIINMKNDGEEKHSELKNSRGALIRDSSLYWLYLTEKSKWVFDRVTNLVMVYNKKYNFEMSYDQQSAQLTRYRNGQKYDWHMDLGPLKSSTRKISAVVELSPAGSYQGGNVEIFYNERDNSHSRLQTGDVLLFPSFVMHRAAEVETGERWSLVFWYKGSAPFR